jgi:hypothetical protein
LNVTTGATDISATSSVTPGKPTKVEFKFRMHVRDSDDMCLIEFKDTGGVTLFNFNAARQASVDAARRSQFVTTFMATLVVGTVYKAVITADWSSGLVSCEVFDGVTSITSSGDLAFTTTTDFGEILIRNQSGIGNNGDGRFDDIKVTL